MVAVLPKNGAEPHDGECVEVLIPALPAACRCAYNFSRAIPGRQACFNVCQLQLLLSIIINRCLQSHLSSH